MNNGKEIRDNEICYSYLWIGLLPHGFWSRILAVGVNWWFTADLHIDHTFMTKNRGFYWTQEHDQAIIEGWNSVVAPRDVVVVLGDVFWNMWNIDWYMNLWKKRLKGSKILVKGNHDRWAKKAKVPSKRIWNKTFKLEGGEKQHIVGCHYAIRSWNRKKHGAIHVHGHSHAKLLPHWHMMDVGVDAAKIILGEWRPFSLNEILYLTKENK